MNWLPEPDGWRKQYEKDGYLVVENAIDRALLGQMRDALERIEREFTQDTLPLQLRRWISVERERSREQRVGGSSDSEAISIIMELPLFDPLFANLIVYPRVLDVLEVLFATTEYSFHNYKAICKMPGNAAPFRWHRDLPYLQHTSPNLITCMLCLDDMTEENGATVVCPGSHLIPHESVKPEDVDMAEADVPSERVTVVCPAGSAVLFHVNIVHGGGPNVSATKRRNVIGIWAGPETYPTIPQRFAYQFVMPRSIDPMRQKQMQMTFGAHGNTAND